MRNQTLTPVETKTKSAQLTIKLQDLKGLTPREFEKAVKTVGTWVKINTNYSYTIALRDNRLITKEDVIIKQTTPTNFKVDINVLTLPSRAIINIYTTEKVFTITNI